MKNFLSHLTVKLISTTTFCLWYTLICNFINFAVMILSKYYFNIIILLIVLLRLTNNNIFLNNVENNLLICYCVSYWFNYFLTFQFNCAERVNEPKYREWDCRCSVYRFNQLQNSLSAALITSGYTVRNWANLIYRCALYITRRDKTTSCTAILLKTHIPL